MSELVGQTLGHYRVVEKIGAGGMGEVYRARDERLDRDVAIKVLPEAVAHEPARLERFEREARAVARLAHPNILEIWDFGSESGVSYAVTELLKGQSLRERVPTSGLPWQKAVEIGAAIADGLAAAHSRGVVHRDLKPDNVFVMSDGRVKILDFGLAAIRGELLTEAETGTLTPEGTMPGTVMGTLGYMSPEQLRGYPADASSDIFSLGCVLYEMVSGRRAFSGTTAAETMAAILKEEPQRLSSSGASLPAELESTIHRCLEKSPEARFQSAADLAYNLRSIGTGSDVPVMATTTDETPGAAGSTRPVVRHYALIATGFVIALVASWWILTQLGSNESTQAPAFQSMSITPVTSLGNVTSAAISPDGRQLAYVRNEAGGRSIWVRQVATGSEVNVIPTREVDIRQVRFTPDGEHLVYWRLDEPGSPGLYSIFQVPTLGGEVRRIVFDADGVPSFSPDGRRFAFRRGIPGKGAALMVARADGSSVRELAIGEGIFEVSWSPGGQTVTAGLYSQETARLFDFDIDSGAGHAVANGVLFPYMTGLAWLPDGDGLLVAGSTPGDAAHLQIWRLSTDEGTLDRVTNDLNDYSEVSLSADGNVLCTVVGQTVGHLFIAPANDPDRIRQLTQGSRERVGDVFANDRFVVFERSPGGREWELWAYNHDGTDLRRVNTVGSEVLPGGVSLVGGEVFFTAEGADSDFQVWRINDSREPPVQVTAAKKGAYGPSLAPDGSWFAFQLITSIGSGGLGHETWKQPVSGGMPELLASGSTAAAISPDGKLVSIVVWRRDSNDVANWWLEVLPKEGGVPLIAIDLEQSGAAIGWRPCPRWRPDGRAVAVLGSDGQVWLYLLDGGPPEQLTHLEQGRITSFAWSPDDKWLYLVREEVTRDAVLIRDFQ